MTDHERNQIIFRRVLACLCLVVFLIVLSLVVTEHAAWFDDPIRNFFYRLRNDPLTSGLIPLTNMANKYFISGLCLILLILPWTRRQFGIPLSAGALGTILVNVCIKNIIGRPRPEVLHLVYEDSFSFPSGHSISSMFFYGMAIWLVWHYISRDEAETLEMPPAAGRVGAETGRLKAVAGRVNAEAGGLSANVEPGGANTAAGPVELRAVSGKYALRYGKRTARILTVLLLIPLVCIGLTRIYFGVHYPTDVLAGWSLGLFAVFIEAEIILALERRSARKH